MRSWFASALALTASAGAIVAAQSFAPYGKAWAQQPGVDVISRIVVEGNVRIESRTVLSYMLIKPGDVYDPARISLSFNALFATDLFQDVDFQWRAGANELVVRVIENPIINRIIFEGNNAV